MTGKPSKLGGAIAKVVGWVVLVGGLFAAFAMYSLLAWLMPGGPASWIVATPMAVLSMIFGGLFVFGGKTLQSSGSAAQKKTRMSAIYSLAAYRKGSLSAAEAASAVNLSEKETSDLLTQVAKDEPDYVVVDLDEAGAIRYRFPTLLPDGHDWETRIADARVRVGGTEINPQAELAEDEAAAEEAARRQKS
jgi:hypothetical protein